MPPIYQTTVYAFENAEQVDAYHAGTPASMYYRQGSPTHGALEAGIASLEGAEAAVTAASGMGIIMAAVLALAEAGDRVVGDRHAYGGTYTLFTAELPRLGIESVLVDALDPEEVERALEGGAKALLVEALSNPTLRVADIPVLCALGRAHSVPVLVDATFASPALLRPIEHGATLSWHSVAKYLGGHSVAAGGVAAGERWLVDAMRTKLIRLGAPQGVMDAWLTLLGLPTLPLRMAAHSKTGQAVAGYLALHPAVEAVYYPGLFSHPAYELARQLYPDGLGGMLSFSLREGEQAARRFLARLQRIAFAPSLADVTTTVSYPYITSHYGLPEEALQTLGVGKGLIRLSAGIEDPADIIAELEQALS
jgi:cystathionine gamma-synthase